MSKHAAGRLPKIHILDGSSSDLATDVMEMPLSWGAYLSSSRDNRKLNQIVPHDVIEIDEDDDQDEVVVIGEYLSGRKIRQTMKTGNVSKNVMKKPVLIIEDDIDVKCQAFKQFDTVRDSSGHHFNKPEILKMTPARKEPAKDWVKRIQHEWKVLEKDLPETIYVRIFEDRMDILRAVIIGPTGTPYHDGLFFFDIYFPPTFPMVPPHFEEFVAEHFRSKGSKILEACRAYMRGAQVGCIFVNEVRYVDNNDKSSSSTFKENLSTIYDQLVMEFTAKGALSDKL